MWKLLEPRSTAASTSGTRDRRLMPGKTRSGGERRAATTRGGGVGIADHELRAFETFAVIDFGAAEILETHGIDQQPHAQALDRRIAVLHVFVEFETVLHARASATLHIDAQHQVRVALVADELAHLGGGGV